VTYNFDPERWYENQRRLLELRHDSAEVDDQAFAELVEDLDRRYEEMLTRLDQSFQLPPVRLPR
jgi:hypothetical protein